MYILADVPLELSLRINVPSVIMNSRFEQVFNM